VRPAPAGAPAPAERRPTVDRGRGYRRIGPKEVEVYDLDLAAWIHMHGVAIVDAVRYGYELVVTFYDPEPAAGMSGAVDTHAVKWLNSEAAKFASHVRQLKKVCLSTGKHHPPREAFERSGGPRPTSR
jgi:hypothetical protein